MRKQYIKFDDFMKGTWNRKKFEDKGVKLITTAGMSPILMIPHSVMAEVTGRVNGGNTGEFIKLLKVAFDILDWGMIVVVIVSGLMWMFAHRTKGIELLLGGSIGYVIARHAIDIMEFLKGLGGGIS